MIPLIKSTLKHPTFSRLGGISVGVILTFCITLGAYKNTIDTMSTDVKEIKPAVHQLQIDIGVIKFKLGIPK